MNEQATNQFFILFMKEIERRLFEESIPRLHKCLGLLSEQEIWQRPNAETVSAGNLVLHLCGNARQWILAGLCGHPDSRQRQKEFDEKGPLPIKKLITQLNVLEKDLRLALKQVKPADLIKDYKVQVFKENGISILVHVVEHFSYHVGQVTYIVKSLKNVDTNYYGEQDLG